MKKYTAKEIAAYIDSTGTLLEIENDGSHTTFKYYLHYKDGELVRSADSADFTTFVEDKFLTELWKRLLDEELEKYEKNDDGEYDFGDYQEAEQRASDRFDGPDGAWSIETVDSPQLLEVAQELADELNEYIKDYED